MNDIKKELFRKSIHLCTAFIPLLLSFAKWPAIALLGIALAGYTGSELLRLRGIHLPLIASITETAARKRDEGRFVLGPCTLCIGVMLSALLFPCTCSRCGIFALAFGDGLASLVGKLWGTHQLPLTRGKTAEGSLACFAAIFLSTVLLVTPDPLLGLVLAGAGMIIEVLPLKDLDNVCIPVLITLIAHCGFGY